MVSFLAKVKIFRFWPKTMDYNKAFYRNRGDFLRSFYSTVEGAMKLNSVPLEMPFQLVGAAIYNPIKSQLLTKFTGQF